MTGTVRVYKTNLQLYAVRKQNQQANSSETSKKAIPHQTRVTAEPLSGVEASKFVSAHGVAHAVPSDLTVCGCVTVLVWRARLLPYMCMQSAATKLVNLCIEQFQHIQYKCAILSSDCTTDKLIVHVQITVTNMASIYVYCVMSFLAFTSLLLSLNPWRPPLIYI